MSANATDAEFLSILRWLEDRTGLRFASHQVRATVATIKKMMVSRGAPSPTELRQLLTRHRSWMDDLINELTVGETYFFRESKQFDFIERVIIPDRFRQRAAGQSLRAWSVACATGEEPYSLAILCERRGWSQVDILASDLSAAAIEKARRAVYRDWSFRGGAIAQVGSYVTRVGPRYQLHEKIRRRVRFQTLNLVEPTYPSAAGGTRGLDLILCRNVLIYFGLETVRQIVSRLYDCLAPGGWLLTGSGDPPLLGLIDLEVNTAEQCFCYQKPVSTGDVAGVSTRLGMELRTVADAAHPPSQASTDLRPPARRLPTARASSGKPKPPRSIDRENLDTCLDRIETLSVDDREAAIGACRSALKDHELAEQLHYLHAVLLADAHRVLEALESLQKALFLNRSFVMAHFLFASIQLGRADYASARRHFKNVCQLCALLEPLDVLPQTRGETVADVAIAAESQLARLAALYGTCR